MYAVTFGESQGRNPRRNRNDIGVEQANETLAGGVSSASGGKKERKRMNGVNKNGRGKKFAGRKGGNDMRRIGDEGRRNGDAWKKRELEGRKR